MCRHDRGEPAVGDLAGEELEKAVELVRVAPHRRRQARRDRLSGAASTARTCTWSLPPNRSTRPSTRTASPSSKRPSSSSTSSQIRASMRPLAIDELEREVGRAGLRPPPLLASDGVDAFDGPVLGELGDAGHAGSLGGRRYARAVADVAPFRAVRYAHPSPAVTAPPYDVLTPELRDVPGPRPHNVVHLTLNESEEEAGRLFRDVARGGRPRSRRRAGGVGRRAGLRRSRRRRPTPRRARGLAPGRAVRDRHGASSRAHARRAEGGPPASAARRARAARADLPPLRRGAARRPCPTASPTSTTADTRLWRLSGEGVAEAFADRQLLIADGHHRYETAVAYAAEEGTPESGRMMVVLVSTSDPGPRDLPHPPSLPRARRRLAAGRRRRLRHRPLRRSPAWHLALRPSPRGRVPERHDLPGHRRGGRARRRARRPAHRPRGTRRTRPTSPRRWRASTQASSTVPSCCARPASRTCSNAPGVGR